MFAPSVERLRYFGYRAGVRATLPFSMLRGQHGQSGFGILMYHRVCEPTAGVPAPTWNVTPQNLHAQLGYLIQHGYEPWRLTSLIARVEQNKPIPRRAFAVTFDDGYRCVATEAYRVLRKLDVPATVFVATGLLGLAGRMPQDDWVGATYSRVHPDCYEAMTWDQCDELSQGDLIDIGSHTHTHGDFRGRPEQFAADIARSMDCIRNRWRSNRVPFAFPYGCSRRGYCTDDLRKVVRRAGFICALTADAKIVDPHQDDRFQWGRILATNDDSGRMLAAKLDDWYGALKKLGMRYFSAASV
jgi:peptidoglycan/xylan/chitin deacetylase (PgdA/CDA1 family)